MAKCRAVSFTEERVCPGTRVRLGLWERSTTGAATLCSAEGHCESSPRAGHGRGYSRASGSMCGQTGSDTASDERLDPGVEPADSRRPLTCAAGGTNVQLQPWGANHQSARWLAASSIFTSIRPSRHYPCDHGPAACADILHRSVSSTITLIRRLRACVSPPPSRP